MRLRVCDHRWSRHMLWALTVVLLLSACSGKLSPPPPLAPLHLPGVSEIPDIASQHGPPGSGVINEVAAYATTENPRNTRVLFLRDGMLFDVGLDGSGLRALMAGCDDSIAAVDSGRWAACAAGGNIALTPLSTAPSGSGGQTLTLAAAHPLSHLAWSRDSALLAADIALGSGCNVAIYQVSAHRDHLRLLGMLSLNELVYPGPPSGCTLQSLAWSPDTSWLAVVANSLTLSPPQPMTLYAIDLGAWLTSIQQPTSQRTVPVPTLSVSSSMLIPLAAAYPTGQPVWSPVSRGLSLAFANLVRTSIERVDLDTHATSTLLSVPEGTIDGLTWAPDGRQLIFALGAGVCGECSPVFTPSHLYVFTPSAS